MEPIEMKGASRNYTIEFGTNAMCRLEEVFQNEKSCGEILDDLLKPTPRIADLRKFVQSVLVDPKMPDLEQVGAIIDDIGGPIVFFVALRQSRHMQNVMSLTPPDLTEEPSTEATGPVN